MPQPGKTDRTSETRRAYVNQTEVPRTTLTQAIRVAQAINDQYAKHPTKPLRVAEALGMAPTTGRFRELTSASSAYGLTDGTAWANQIALTELGKRVVAPSNQGDDSAARVEAVLRPRIIREFLTRYDSSKLPSTQIALNVLEEMGVPKPACQRTLEVIFKNADDLGLVRMINGQRYVDLQNAAISAEAKEPPLTNLAEEVPDGDLAVDSVAQVTTTKSLRSSKRVFITHGKNKEIVQQLKELLSFGEFEPVIAVEHETTARSVPDKVLDDMRTCGAAIVHIGTEQKLIDKAGNEVSMLNPNVLIEIGAALALYGRKFILLVEEGALLPSNLQGLYQVRYSGAKLDYESTMRLLKAFSDFKS